MATADSIIPAAWGRSMAWTPTPRTLARCGLNRCGPGCSARYPSCIAELTFDPFVGDFKTLVERNRGFPSQDLPNSGVVAVAAANSLRLAQVMPLHQTLLGNLRNQIDESIDSDELLGAKIQRLIVITCH